MTGSAPSIVCSNVVRSFGAGATTVHVLKDLSLEIFPSELTLIIGPSGCGKSTLLAVLSGLLRPSSGRVIAHGTDLWSLGQAAIDRFRLAHCGFVFQGFNLFTSLTAHQQVMLPLNYAGIAGDEADDRAYQALDAVGLGPRAHLRPIELSGGEKQRVAIARALVKNPPLIFADEPTSALDKDNGRRIIELLHVAAHERNASILCVSHDQRLIDHADRVVRMEDGRIQSDESRRAAQPQVISEVLHP
jgi:putative ABC transport system ATP-binding protein